METIYININNNKTDKINSKDKNKIVALANLSIYYTWKNVKEKYSNSKFKITGPTSEKSFDLPDGSYNVSQIQDYCEFVIKQHETIADDNFPVRIYENNTNNRIVFKIKVGYKLELLTNETMKLSGDGPVIDKDKNSPNLPQLENVTTVLVHCNIVQNNYQRASKVLYAFVSDKSYGQLISIHPSSLIKLKATDSEFNFMEVWFSNQDNKPLEVEDNVNVTLIIRPPSL